MESVFEKVEQLEKVVISPFRMSWIKLKCEKSLDETKEMCEC